MGTHRCAAWGDPVPPDAILTLFESIAGRWFIGYADPNTGEPLTRESQFYRTEAQARRAFEDNTFWRSKDLFALKSRLIARPGPRPADDPAVPLLPVERPEPKNYSKLSTSTPEAQWPPPQLEEFRRRWQELDHPGDRWTVEEIEWAIAAREAGWTWRQIAIVSRRCLLRARQQRLMGRHVAQAVERWRTRGRLASIGPTIGPAEDWTGKEDDEDD